jgi:hypothetical protein
MSQLKISRMIMGPALIQMQLTWTDKVGSASGPALIQS